MEEGTKTPEAKTQAAKLGTALDKLNEASNRVDAMANDISDKLLGTQIPYDTVEATDKPIVGLLTRTTDCVLMNVSRLNHTLETLHQMLHELGGKD